MTNSDEGANGRAWRMAAACLAAGVPGWGGRSMSDNTTGRQQQDRDSTPCVDENDVIPNTKIKNYCLTG